MSRTKLLVVSHDFSLTGAPIALFNALLGLREHYDILVVSQIDGPLRAELLDAGFQTLLVPGVLNDVQATVNYLNQFDALLANTLVSCVPIYAAHQLGKPSLWYIHEGHFGLDMIKHWRPVLPDAFSLVSRVAVPAKFTRDLYSPWLGNKPVDIVPYGVPNQELPSPAPPDRPLQVLQLGSIEPRKGQDIALAAFRSLPSDRFVLNFVGQTLQPAYHQQLLSDFADVRHARFLGGAYKEQIASLIAACDLLIVPSRDEVTPMVILEAMSLGKPVIASRICGIPEMIDDGQTGFLFESENHQQLADLIRRLGDDPDLRQKIGQRARDVQRQTRTLDQCSAHFHKILRQMLAK